MRGSPPLRFLAVVLGGWTALRIVFIAPPWPAAPAGVVAAAAQSPAQRAPGRRRVAVQLSQVEHAVPRERPPATPAFRPSSLTALARPHPMPSTLTPARMPSRPAPGTSMVKPPLQFSRPPPAVLAPTRAAVSKERWSSSAWAFVRRGDSPTLAAGGLLGGSQAGARLAYRLNRDSARPLALSVRLAAPLRRPAGAEAALGLDWRPAARLPIHVLAERRLALGREGRSAFAVTAYGGVSDAPLGPFRIDAYAQAGIVGARSLDPFGDGSLRLSIPLGGRARLGAGAWAAAQPGLSRLDLGPQAAIRLPAAGRTLTLAADWRLRVAGNARPGSGPTLTMSTDF